MEINERIAKVLEYSGLSPSEFADEIDVQRSNISHITSGRNKPSLDFLIKLKDRFPELQWDWLIYGKGEMIQDKVDTPVVEKPKTTSLPDLFSLIADDNFGITESEDRIANEPPRESEIPLPTSTNEKIFDSQRLAVEEKISSPQHTNNQSSKIKRIVLFFDDGKFESFEP
ncbi:helix-turn-helix domain-containing protein [Chryseobacterium koreense]|uniref:Transcriptional regulator n=1 Tax=Chryseobacterium koreense CCUG 49689 TaxID=1304281 RepID=A0A0J7LUM8_9FLAO|nr:helix-turn-helix transcriptional regulator [Chryseobacterium koreense]KMQ72625.1 transcriptional regulator [Chryseobacterium koreense CCUG 49689]MBB5333018.1 transcriptional regulator with XRE-family HTH domain [Chryseobacterium koreense]